MSNITKQGNLITTEIYETDAVVEDENLLNTQSTITLKSELRMILSFVTKYGKFKIK